MRLIPLIFAALAVLGDTASAGGTRETKSGNMGPISGLCDGAADDRTAIQAALDDATRKIVFPKDAACMIEAPITIPADLDVDFNGTIIRRTTSDTTENFQVQVQSGSIIRNLTLEVPAGVTILRGINLADGAQAHDVKVTAVSQQNNLGSSERAAFNVHGDDTLVDRLTVENFDKAIRSRARLTDGGATSPSHPMQPALPSRTAGVSRSAITSHIRRARTRRPRPGIMAWSWRIRTTARFPVST